jgi:hypothetical protein
VALAARVRAEENQGERSPRCAGQAIGGRFLATDARDRPGTAKRSLHPSNLLSCWQVPGYLLKKSA